MRKGGKVLAQSSKIRQCVVWHRPPIGYEVNAAAWAIKKIDEYTGCEHNNRRKNLPPLRLDPNFQVPDTVMFFFYSGSQSYLNICFGNISVIGICKMTLC